MSTPNSTSTRAPGGLLSEERPKKLTGRAFYESIGSPKYVVAPMVDQSEFAWRMLTRSYMPESQRSSVLAYSPMLHARLFSENQGYRDSHFQPTRTTPASSSSDDDPQQPAPWLDGNPSIDRPLFVQFCANDPDALLDAARRVTPHCDAVDLNLGCPQGIAKKGRYGAFLQEDQDLIHRLIRTLRDGLDVPVTAKIRVLDTPEATLAYARNVLDAGASILTVHGRRREQKGHLTGLADWRAIRHLRENLPPDTVIFANGNILQHGDLGQCLEATGADAVMSAEGNLSDPTIFAPEPPVGQEGREYWRGVDGKGGFRVDAVMRRYLDILHCYVEDEEPPARRPLFIPGDDEAWLGQPLETQTPVEIKVPVATDEAAAAAAAAENGGENGGQPARKKRRKEKKAQGDTTGIGKKDKCPSPNYIAVKAHLFHMLRHFVSRHTDVRDAVARSRLGDGYLAYLERVLDMVERRVAAGILEYQRTGGRSLEDEEPVKVASKQLPQALVADGAPQHGEESKKADDDVDEATSSVETVKRCRRPWWVVQPIVRPLPKEAEANGAIQAKKVKGQATAGKANGNGQMNEAKKRPHPGTPEKR